MNGLLSLVAVAALAAAGCSTADVTPAPPADKAHMNMLQLMRAFPFPHSNVIFDTQSRDPEGPEKKASMSFSVYRWVDADTYAGWSGVENSALALTEMAPMLLIPRACANGNPAPVERDEWKKAVQGLVATGEELYATAKKKNTDAMLDASEKLASACAACHDLYRDVDLTGGERCALQKAAE
jgi:hypothetical protein